MKNYKHLETPILAYIPYKFLLLCDSNNFYHKLYTLLLS